MTPSIPSPFTAAIYEFATDRLIDSKTRAIREVVSIAPDRLELWSVTRDNSAAYFVRIASKADIWLMKLK